MERCIVWSSSSFRMLVLLAAFVGCREEPALQPVESGGPQPPSLFLPDTSRTGNYILWWSVVGEATSYLVEEDDTPAFENPRDFYTGTDTITRAAGKSFGSSFSYRVRGSNLNGPGAWSSTHSVVVSPGDHPVIQATDTIAFGNVVVDSISEERSVCIANNGTAPLLLNAITPGGNPSFTVLPPTSFPVSVAAGDSLCFPVSFLPSGVGFQQETITVFSDDLDDYPPKIFLYGIGVGGVPVVTVDRDTLVFEIYSPVGEDEAMLTVGNDGPVTLSVNDITVDDPSYSVLHSVPFDVPPGSSEPVAVKFSESVVGTYPGTMTIQTNDPFRSGLEVYLDGIVYREVIIAGINNSTLFRSLDVGTRWRESGDGIGFPGILGPVLWFLTDQRTFLVSVQNDGSIYASTDAGVSWMPRSLFRPVAFAEGEAGRLFAISGGSIFFSDDLAFTWTELGSPGTGTAVAVATNGSGDIFVGYSGPQGTLQRSTDGGMTWGKVFTGSILSIAVGRNAELVLSVAGQGVFRSTDNGGSWVVIDELPLNSLLSGRGNEVLLSYSAPGSYRSPDDGANWILMSDLFNADSLRFGFSPFGDLYGGDKGGQVFRSTDQGASWVLVTDKITDVNPEIVDFAFWY